MGKRAAIFVLAAWVLWTGIVVYGDSDSDERAVREAVLDYVEGVYDMQPERIERSVHPELAKRGFYKRGEDQPYTEVPMTFERLVDLAANYNKDGKVPKDAVKKIEIYEVLDKTASIKLTAHWGIDYMHLAKYEGRWLIVNVMWQQHPE